MFVKKIDWDYPGNIYKQPWLWNGMTEICALITTEMPTLIMTEIPVLMTELSALILPGISALIIIKVSVLNLIYEISWLMAKFDIL